MEFPLVTVFTLIYNTNPRYIIEAIESTRDNDYPNIQHIIIDDGSPNPEPKEIVKKWIAEHNYPCEFYEHKNNYGICKTLNHVLELAKGKYLVPACDDLLMPNRINDDVQWLENLDDTYALVISNAEFINSENQSLNQIFPGSYPVKDDEFFNYLILKNLICAPAVTIKTNVLRDVGLYNESLMFEDYEMWLRLSFKGYKFKFYNKVNSKYRIHSESLTQKKDNNYQIRKLKEELRIQKMYLDFVKLNDLNTYITFHHNFVFHNQHKKLLGQMLVSIFELFKYKSLKLIHIKALLKLIY